MLNDIESWVKVAAFAGAGLSMGLGAIGAAIGEGFAAAKANDAIARSPDSSGDIFKLMLVGQAVAETAAIFALVIGVILLFSNFSAAAPISFAALLGAGICMGFGAMGSGVGSGFPAGEACEGVSRQPAVKGNLTTTMLIGSAVSQTPAIFAMVVAFMLMFINFSGAPLHPTSAALLGAGFATGLAAIGSGLGSGLAAGASCQGSARQPLTSANVTIIMLVGQAVAQTPSIFGLLISFVLMFKSHAPSETLAASFALASAGLCTGFGGIGPGVGNGMTAQSAVMWVARNVKQEAVLMRTMLVGQAVSQSTAIYAMVIALALIFLI
jgi:F-type H+-transporting ATPase subunit c